MKRRMRLDCSKVNVNWKMDSNELVLWEKKGKEGEKRITVEMTDWDMKYLAMTIKKACSERASRYKEEAEELEDVFIGGFGCD